MKFVFGISLIFFGVSWAVDVEEQVDQQGATFLADANQVPDDILRLVTGKMDAKTAGRFAMADPKFREAVWSDNHAYWLEDAREYGVPHFRAHHQTSKLPSAYPKFLEDQGIPVSFGDVCAGMAFPDILESGAVRCLLKSNVDVNAKEVFQLPAWFAGRTGIWLDLIDTVKSSSSETLLNEAILWNHLEAVQIILRNSHLQPNAQVGEPPRHGHFSEQKGNF